MDYLTYNDLLCNTVTCILQFLQLEVLNVASIASILSMLKVCVGDLQPAEKREDFQQRIGMFVLQTLVSTSCLLLNAILDEQALDHRLLPNLV